MESSVNGNNETPFLLKALPFIAGGGIFAYLLKYKKKGYKFSGGIASVVFLLAALPWIKSALSNKTTVAPAASTGTANDTGPAVTLEKDAAGHLNSMDKTGRKAAIDYIIGQENNMAANKNYLNGNLPSEESRVTAFNTLTNDELKVLYCIYHFIEDRQSIMAKYGSTQDEKVARVVAKDLYGIDLSGIADMEKVASIGITKTLEALNMPQ